jgi:hypothetical protein
MCRSVQNSAFEFQMRTRQRRCRSEKLAVAQKKMAHASRRVQAVMPFWQRRISVEQAARARPGHGAAVAFKHIHCGAEAEDALRLFR